MDGFSPWFLGLGIEGYMDDLSRWFSWVGHRGRMVRKSKWSSLTLLCKRHIAAPPTAHLEA